MSREYLLAVVIVIGLLLLALMIAGWRTRRARQRELPKPAAVPEELGSLIHTQRGKYVATCLAGQPLERVVAHGLGFRGTADLTVAESGVLVDRVGEPALFVPVDTITRTGRATYTIDRVVEPDGLTLLEWRLGDTLVDTTLRVDDPAALDAALATLLDERPSA